MADRKRILITGAAGRIAQMVRVALEDDHDLSGIDLHPAEGIADCLVANATDLDAIRPAFREKDVVIDFANNPSGNLTWDEAYANNIHATFNSMRAAQEAGVRRYIYTSSNRATEEYQQDEPYASICKGDYAGLDPAKLPLIDSSMPVRPNGPYGIGKAAAEAAGRYLSDKFGMSVICLRLAHHGPRRCRPAATSASSPRCSRRETSSNSTSAASTRQTTSSSPSSTASRTTSGSSGTSATPRGSSATGPRTTWRRGAARLRPRSAG